MRKAYRKEFNNTVSLSNKQLQRILKFYLFECPVPGKSWRGCTFAEYGISGQRAFGYLKKQMLIAASESLKTNYKPCKKFELEKEFESKESVSPPTEICIFMCNEERTVMQSLFSAIRNAFAHGSFRVDTYNKKRIYYLLNFDGYKKAEIILHEATLLAWIDLIIGFNHVD